MATIEAAKLSFSSGLFAPRLRIRNELERHGSACAELENFIVTMEGVLIRRPGTRYISAAKNNSYARLVCFKRDSETTYMLEFSAGKIRIIKDEFYITVDGQEGSSIIEISTPYTADEIRELKFCQNKDRMFFTVKSRPVMYLKRNSEISWEFREQGLVNNPFGAGNYPACCTFFQQRLWFGGTNENPQKLWGSRIGVYTDFSARSTLGNNILPTSGWSQNYTTWGDTRNGSWIGKSSSYATDGTVNFTCDLAATGRLRRSVTG